MSLNELPSPTDTMSAAQAGTKVSVNRERSALYTLPEPAPNQMNRSSETKLYTSPTSSISGPYVTAPDAPSIAAMRNPLDEAIAKIPA